MRGSAAALACVLTVPAIAFTQDREALANDPKLFLERASETLGWTQPTDPIHVAGPVYFVGTQGLAAWLIETSQGHILLNTAMPGSGPMIAASIRTLGLRPEDVKILLAGHAHVDHVGGHAYIQKLSGARVAMVAEEVDLIESGGKLDFHYGAVPEFAFDPVRVDQVLRDGDQVRLGDVALTAHLTPGHTKGSTTYSLPIAEKGRPYLVVFPDGTSINPGYRLIGSPSYPGIADNYRRTFAVLEKLKPDIWLSSHTDFFDFEGKRARAAREGVAAWVDPEGYRKAIADARAKFEATIKTESESVAGR
jgi:metallo-beta-lactamase class B